MVALHIEDEEFYQLAKVLAERHNRTVPEIVAEALREFESRESPKPGDPGFVEYWMKRTERPDRPATEPPLSVTHGDLLYDERGLPR